MHEYDVALKLLLRESAGMVMREIAGDVAKWINVELPEVRNTRVDLLGETGDGGLVHIELQSRNDAGMALRMAEYCLRVYRLFGKFPRQIALYVGNDPLRMDAELAGTHFRFEYKLTDIRELDGEKLLESPNPGDNLIAILARLRDQRGAVRAIIGRMPGMEPDAREYYLRILLMLAGLRNLEEDVEKEARKVPILNDILDNKVLGREFRRGLEEGVQQGVQQGELTLVRRLIEAQFGPIPQWAEDRLSGRSAAELEELGVRLLHATDLRDLLR